MNAIAIASPIPTIDSGQSSEYDELTDRNKSAFPLNQDLIRQIFANFYPEFVVRSRIVSKYFFKALDPKQMSNYWMGKFTLTFANKCDPLELIPPQNWYENYKNQVIKQRMNLRSHLVAKLGKYRTAYYPVQRLPPDYRIVASEIVAIQDK